MENVTPWNTPLRIGIVLDSNMSPKTNSEKKGMDNKPYRSILGSVMWGQLATRPDLAFSISLLACFQANPGIEHWKALIHVVGYIRNTLDYGLTYSQDFDISPTAFVNADVRLPVALLLDTSSQWLVELSPGVVNDSLPSHYLLSKPNTSPCHDAHNKCCGSVVGWIRSKLSILSPG